MIEVQVVGQAKSGKSTVGMVILEALRKAGFQVAIVDGDKPSYRELLPTCARRSVARRHSIRILSDCFLPFSQEEGFKPDLEQE